MRIIIDIEANGLVNPDKIWVIVCKDIDTKQLHIFREVTEDGSENLRFRRFANRVLVWVGHNICDYDFPVLNSLLTDLDLHPSSVLVDTFVVSKMANYARGKHSIEAYGDYLGYPKKAHHYLDFFKKYSKELEEYCIRDVEITEKIYTMYLEYIENNIPSITMEQSIQSICSTLNANGFAFDKPKAEKLLVKVKKDLEGLDKEISAVFLPRAKLIREVHPRVTKHGTLSRTDFRWVKDGDLSQYNGGPFSRIEWVVFNPASHKQVITVLNKAGWKPVNKTKAHVELEREYKKDPIDLLKTKLDEAKVFGWKIDENNLSTLPASAPAPARTLARRILLESRRRTLTEWTELCQSDGRIHGKFLGIGAWTHRMAHQEPNTANIPSPSNLDGSVKLLGKELRSLWRAPDNRLLVGVDAEGIQLRIFAHYIDDEEFTDALVRGKKADKTDPHSLNARILGSVCKGRAAAKRFIYALLLGAGIGKLAAILEATVPETQEALDRLIRRYAGFALLKEKVIPRDAKNGYFRGLDDRRVPIFGNTVSERKHLAMSGYLQNGEAVIMKRACLLWHEWLKDSDDWIFVDFVHDEWQTEVPNDLKRALEIAEIQRQAIVQTGIDLKLKCPLEGSYYNDDRKDYTVGTNWYQTH